MSVLSVFLHEPSVAVKSRWSRSLPAGPRQTQSRSVLDAPVEALEAATDALANIVGAFLAHLQTRDTPSVVASADPPSRSTGG
jgi:hypothetical protein